MFDIVKEPPNFKFSIYKEMKGHCNEIESDIREKNRD